MATALKRPLNNVERLARNRGVNVVMLYDIDKHKYRGLDGRVHYVPYRRPRGGRK